MGLKARKAAEVAAKQQVDAETDAKRHLLVKVGADRDVREAYLHGLVFAGLANDDEVPEIQSEERTVLDEISAALVMENGLLDEIVTTEKASIDNDTYMDLLRECLGSFTDIKMYDAFLEDFDKVWSTGKGKSSELKSWHGDFEKMVSPNVAEVLAERKSVEAKRDEEEKAKHAAAEKARKAKLKAKRQKKVIEDRYHQMQGFVQDWISTKRVTQDVLLRVKDYLKVQYSSIPVQTLLRETCKQLIKRVLELDRKGKASVYWEGAAKIALETTWIVICLVLLRCKVSELKMKTINELLDHARYEDFADGYSLSCFWRDPRGLGDYHPRVEDFFVKASGLARVWDEVSDALLSMTEDQKQQMDEWRSERKRYKSEAEEAFASSIGVNRFMLQHEEDVKERGFTPII